MNQARGNNGTFAVAHDNTVTLNYTGLDPDAEYQVRAVYPDVNSQATENTAVTEQNIDDTALTV